MIRAIVLLLIVVAGLVIGPIWAGNPGYVQIVAGNYTIETSVVFAVIALMAFLLIIWLIEFIVRRVLSGKRVSLHWWKSRKQRKADHQMRQAFSLWLSKDYQKAAIAAEKSAKGLRDPAQAYLFAAIASDQAGNTQAQKRLLDLAGESQSVADHGNAEYGQLLSEIEKEQGAANALKLSEQLLTDYRRYPATLPAVAQALAKHGHWETLRKLLPELEQKNTLSEYQLFDYTRRCYQPLFRSQASHSEKLKTIWDSLPAKQRRNRAIRMAYLDTLVARGYQDATMHVALKGLRKDIIKPSDLLEYDSSAWPAHTSLRDYVAEQVKKHAENPDWLLLFANLALKDNDAELAEKAVQQAIKIQPDRRSYKLLGDILAKGNQKEAALSAYRKALS